MKNQIKRNFDNRGFTLVQMVTVISIIGIIAGVVFQSISNLPGNVARHKLTSDVRSINAAIDIYSTFGGNLAGVETAAEVIAKLQTQADAISAEQTPGLTGNLVDRRLKPVMLAENETHSGRERAIWNPVKRRFVIATEGEAGVERFDLDDAHAGAIVAVESRQQNLKLASVNGWIWDYDDHDAGAAPAPTKILNVYAGGGGPGGSPGPGEFGGGEDSGEFGGGGTPGGGSGSSGQKLDPPLFSIGSGTYPITDFDLALTLANPNPGGISRILYKIDTGMWNVYSSTSIAVPPNSVVTAFCESIDADWANSDEAERFYDAEAVKLKKPKIKNNNGHGNNIDGVDSSNPGGGNGGPNGEIDPSGDIDDEKKWVEVTLEDLNEAGLADLEYSVNGGGWVTYSGTFTVYAAEFPLGVVIDAKAKSLEIFYDDSELALDRLEWLDPVPLDHPAVSWTADETSNAHFTVTVENANNPSMSVAEYRVDGGAWQEYEGPFNINTNDHQGESATIDARVVGSTTLEVDGEVLTLPPSGEVTIVLEGSE